MAGRDRGKHQTAGLRYSEAFRAKESKRPVSNISFKGHALTKYAQQFDKKFELSYQKREKLIQLKETLQKRSAYI